MTTIVVNIVTVLVLSIFTSIAIIAFVIRVPIIVVVFSFFLLSLHSHYGQCFIFFFLAIDLIKLVWKTLRNKFFSQNFVQERYVSL